MKTRFTRLAFMALAMMVAIPAWATLQLDVGGSVDALGVYTAGTVYTDGSIQDLAPGTVGTLVVAAGGVQFNVAIASVISGSPTASLTLTAIGQPNLAPQTVRLLISDNNFSVPATPLFLNQTATVLSATTGPNATVTGVGYFGNSNTNFDTDSFKTGVATGSVTNGTTVGVGASSGLIPNPTPYSLTSFITVNILTTGSTTNPNLTVQAALSASAVPEPTSVVFLGTALLSVSALLRKKFKQS
jgi:hypothetical protein